MHTLLLSWGRILNTITKSKKEQAMRSHVAGETWVYVTEGMGTEVGYKDVSASKNGHGLLVDGVEAGLDGLVVEVDVRQAVTNILART